MYSIYKSIFPSSGSLSVITPRCARTRTARARGEVEIAERPPPCAHARASHRPQPLCTSPTHRIFRMRKTHSLRGGTRCSDAPPINSCTARTILEHGPWPLFAQMCLHDMSRVTSFHAACCADWMPRTSRAVWVCEGPRWHPQLDCTKRIVVERCAELTGTLRAFRRARQEYRKHQCLSVAQRGDQSR
jgi:hypothetical protein